ncbi:MAG: sugar phosphate nucleotidyltransferase [Planctomycetota bacterium]
MPRTDRFPPGPETPCASTAPGSSHAEIVAQLAADPRAVVVVDDEGRAVGVVGDRELRAAALRGLAESAPVVDLMDRDPVWLDASPSDDDLRESLEAVGASAAVVRDGEGRPTALHDRRDLFAARDRARHAILMVGGEGTRLRPLTAETPKPLLPVGGRPILERIVERLREHGVERVTMALGYRAEQIERHFGDGADFGVAVDYVREERPLGTAGAIGMVEVPTAGPLLVMNGDIVTNLDFTAMALEHARRGAAVTVAARPYQHQVPYGVLRLVGGRIVDIAEKPTRTWWTNAGVYLMDAAVVGRIERDRYLDMTMLVEGLIGDGRDVESFPLLEYWCDIGLPADYERANRRLSEPGTP